MKTKNKLIMLALSMIELTNMTSAKAQGSGGVGGGDACTHAIDSDRKVIKNWISDSHNYTAKIDFGKARIKGLTNEIYKSKMLPVLAEGKVVVTCYLDPVLIGDPATRKLAEAEHLSYKSITRGNPGKPETCINYEDDRNISHIDCDYQKILLLANSGNPDYELKHHEFAAIAGVEQRNFRFNEEEHASPEQILNEQYLSDHSISEQLGRFDTVKKIHLLGPFVEETAMSEIHLSAAQIDATGKAKLNWYLRNPNGWFSYTYDVLPPKPPVLTNGTNPMVVENLSANSCIIIKDFSAYITMDDILQAGFNPANLPFAFLDVGKERINLADALTAYKYSFSTYGVRLPAPIPPTGDRQGLTENILRMASTVYSKDSIVLYINTDIRICFDKN